MALLNSNSFLNTALGALQFLIIILPLTAKGKLYNRTPANLMGKKRLNFLQRTHWRLYIMLCFSMLSVCILIRKDQIQKGCLIINNKTKELRSERIVLPPKGNGSEMHPYLSENNVFPTFVDTSFDVNKKLYHFIVSENVWNSGTGKAKNVNVKAFFILKSNDQTFIGPPFATKIDEIAQNSGAMTYIRTWFKRPLAESDTIYLIVNMKYENVHQIFPSSKTFYYCYVKESPWIWYHPKEEIIKRINLSIKNNTKF